MRSTTYAGSGSAWHPAPHERGFPAAPRKESGLPPVNRLRTGGSQESLPQPRERGRLYRGR